MELIQKSNWKKILIDINMEKDGMRFCISRGLMVWKLLATLWLNLTFGCVVSNALWFVTPMSILTMFNWKWTENASWHRFAHSVDLDRRTGSQVHTPVECRINIDFISRILPVHSLFAIVFVCFKAHVVLIETFID